MDEFAARVFQELNYVQEGINAERFARLYGDRPDVVVPGIEWDYTSPKVITMDWIQGTKLSDQESLKGWSLLARAAATTTNDQKAELLTQAVQTFTAVVGHVDLPKLRRKSPPSKVALRLPR